MKNSSLLVFTIDFPYGKGESFLFNEIKILSNKFQMIYIFPMNYSDNQFEYELPENVQVVKFNMFQPFNRLKVLFKNSALISSIYFSELIQSSSRLKYLRQFFQTLNNLTHKISAANNFSIICKQMKIDNPIAYTYWFNQWTLILSIINAKYQKINLYTRIHGMDVYEDQHYQKKFFFQFRVFQLKQIKKVFAISSNGKLHFEGANPVSVNKVVVSRLGTQDYRLNKIENLSFLRIVSCSSLH